MDLVSIKVYSNLRSIPTFTLSKIIDNKYVKADQNLI